MAKRLISAGIAVPLGILILCIDNPVVYLISYAVLSAVAVYELLVATKYTQNHFISVVSIVFSLLVPVLFEVDFLKERAIPICSFFIFILFIIMLFKHEKIRFENLTMVAFISICIPLAICSLLFMRMRFLEFGRFYMIFALISAWIGDAGAYFVGTFIGKHKLAPTISPKKTVEGFIGGILTSGIFGFLLGFGYQLLDSWCNGKSTISVNIPVLVVLALICSVLGVIGDLSASIVKRQCLVKDFGNFLPGHGGVLDRFDSVLFVAPFLYLLFQYYQPVTML